MLLLQMLVSEYGAPVRVARFSAVESTKLEKSAGLFKNIPIGLSPKTVLWPGLPDFPL
jgi:hypothetical protein